MVYFKCLNKIAGIVGNIYEGIKVDDKVIISGSNYKFPNYYFQEVKKADKVSNLDEDRRPNREKSLIDRYKIKIKGLGKEYKEPITNNTKHRITTCRKCKKDINNGFFKECYHCNRIICNCGSCGCGRVGLQ